MDSHAQFTLLTGGNMAADIATTACGLNLYYGYFVQANYSTSGSLGGSLALQGSSDHRRDPEGNVLNQGTFITIPDSVVAITGAGSWGWNVQEAQYSYFRVIYTHASGDSGTLNVYATIKGG